MKVAVAAFFVAFGVFTFSPALDADQSAPSAPASVQGRVIASDTGLAVRMASVRLILQFPDRASQQSVTFNAWTDVDGRFMFTDLPGGRYTLSVSKAGYVTTFFGPSGSSVVGVAPANLSAGSSIDRGDLTLWRGGVITGRAFDDFGEPISDVTVAALRIDYTQPGIRRISRTRAAVTDDLGDFRIFGLLPGRYYIAATMGQTQISVTEPGEDTQRFVASVRGLAPTYFPGTPDAAGAQAIQVQSGSTTASIDIRLAATPLARLSGNVTDTLGRPATDVVVMLSSTRPDDLVPWHVVDVDANGRFTFSNVAPGEYRLDVESRAAMTAIAQTGSVTGRSQTDQSAEFASIPVTVTGIDIDNLSVQTSRGARLTGRVTVEGTPDASRLESIRIHVLPIGVGQSMAGVLQGAMTSVAADGRFDVRGLSGHRLVRLSGLPPGWVLKSVRAHGVEVADDGLAIGGDDVTGVDIVVTAKPTEVHGTAVDERGVATSDYTVIVFSEDRRLWTVPSGRFVTSARPDATGVFRAVGLPEGRYHIVAVDRIDAGEWAEPESLERMRSRASTVMLREGQPLAVTLVRFVP